MTEEGSFTKEADRLDVPASALSLRIAALEQQLGERLFIRITRKMTITPFGQAILRLTTNHRLLIVWSGVLSR
ncbi:helix-turn-helix domain-containing protein [Tatumella ptyseos]|uniref:helix-turn-helix domain-containing protein n=1 Tax=Tatumella ptyseos TaxID=82987 RepID=UPI0026EE1952|nr:LysR family transcriptional regulator [Tatumella ptyseos]WKX27977.1 LysR family transcriptional regulator [Tatumella ptyseos]